MNRIKQLRKAKGLSIDQLSNELKNQNTPISSASISKYEREKRNPKIKSWEILANYFNVSVPYIQGLSDNEEHTASQNKSISTIISTIYSILIYLGRHTGTGYIPENIKNGLMFSRSDDVKIQDILFRLINLVDLDSEDYLLKYDKLVKKFSEKVVAKFEKEGITKKEATKEDVSNVIGQYYQVINDYFFNLQTTDNVIDNTILNLSHVIEQLNMDLLNKDVISRRFKRDENGHITKMISEPVDGTLPKKISKETYSQIMDVLNNSVNELLALRKDKTKSSTFFVE